MLDGCLITGTTFGTGYGEHQGGDYEKIEQLDADCTGFETLCEALGASQVASISLKKCYLGPQAMSFLAAATPKMPSITDVNMSVNPIGHPRTVRLKDGAAFPLEARQVIVDNEHGCH